MEWVSESDICLEISLISNLRTGVIQDLQEHPILTFVDSGVPFVLRADNPQVHEASLSKEYELFYALTGRKDLIESMFEKQIKYSFQNKGV
jgi:adenosine deaminase